MCLPEHFLLFFTHVEYRVDTLRHVTVLELLPLFFIKHVQFTALIHGFDCRLLDAIMYVQNIAKEGLPFLANIVHIEDPFAI